ncbi:MAG: DUF1501 domain-containing protein [Gemmataceae bacterium]
MHAEQLKRNPGDAELEAVAASYELAWRMQANAPDTLDLTKESAETLKLYGVNEKGSRRTPSAGVSWPAA